MSIGDFHTHSTQSDGVLSPAQLVDLAASRGVRVMALTDHDTLAGLDEAIAAAARHPGFTLIPGVELSCDVPGSEVHMLGHFVDRTNREFTNQLERFRRGRVERAEKMVGALEALGAPIDWERVQEIAGEGSVGRPHVAQALLEQGHVETITDAFDRYLGRNGPAYFEREKLTPPQAIEMIRNANGLPVFAHPSFTEDYPAVAASLAADGLFGMEVFYKAYPPDLVQSLHELATAHGLFALGGSDYHGLGNDDDREPGEIPLPDAVAEAYLAAAREAGCEIPEPAPGG
ncbi:MAG: PHP domain-containing protein [Dehalococcoidia bacterium]